MFIKKSNIIFIVISIINVLLFFKFIFSKHESDFCLLSNVQSFDPFSSDNNRLQGIRKVIQNEVIDLEKQRESLINEITAKTAELSKLNNEVYQYSIKSYRIRNSIISLSQIRKDFQRRHKSGVDFKPIISKFKDVSTVIDYTTYVFNSSINIDIQKCSVFSCFNFQNCAFNNSNILTFSMDYSLQQPNGILTKAVEQSVFYNKLNPCLMLVFNSTGLINRCDNKNCVIISNENTNFISRAIRSNFFFTKYNYRCNYDIVTPVLPLNDEISISKLPMIFPLRRRYLLSFTTSVNMNNLPKIDQFLLKYLQNISIEIQKETGNNNFYVDLNCIASKSHQNRVFNDWNLCQNSESRLKRLAKSKFCLILSHWNIDILTTEISQQRLFECLLTGSIPVILGDIALPFEEIIDWNRASLRFPKQQIVQIVNLIEKIPDSSIFQMKLYNRKIFELHFVSSRRQIDSIGFVLTKRIGLALPTSPTIRADLIYTTNRMPLYNFTLPNFQIELDPYLGPNNIPPTNSMNITNKSIKLSASHFRTAFLANNFNLYPSTPWDPSLPTDGVLRGYSTRGYYGINHSTNEAGSEFMHSLGGNHVYEQFTLVILSYKRHNLLRKSLEMLNGLPYLHSIIVIWNDPSPPSKFFLWPKLHVDIKIVKSKINSLNSRFLPYDLIHTDAVLSFDDDIQLRHDEIVFAFRVWRENRDRIVGFPARYHNEYPGPAKVRYTNNQWWMYNSNYTCEYSMVLTGAAFFHRFYLYAYSNDMNPVIREIVDKYKNCEDIAMNFLVSHITRSPPLKVTVRWTFSCVNCDSESGNRYESLHNRPDHYQIRSNCINEFSAIYGYNPLLYTQYRADSVLFKTRLPADKQKCFRYV